jgi:hypothetical protein
MIRAGFHSAACLLLLAGTAAHAQEYFQQQVDHVIHVRLDDEAHMLHAFQRITYTNNSPHALDTIWLHLWPNAYRDPNSALDRQLMRSGDLSLHFATDEERGWIDSLEFRVGAPGADSSTYHVVPWGHHPEHADIGWLKLGTSLPPGSSTVITTPFRVKIPDSRFSRLGHTGQAYHITQWYPKPAVYDRDGWHPMPYLSQGEFYNEYGSFDVHITLPANYVVGATGILQDAPDEERFLNRLARSGLVTEDAGFPDSDSRTKTLRYVQDNVHDHAWFADKRFQVRKGSVQLPRSGRSITTWVMFTPANANLWSNAIDYVNESVRLYSQWVGDYPYDACTAVDGTISAGGGMEYPMITIIGTMSDAQSLDNVIAHEVGHNWFQGMLGSNERLHPWLDEGVNSFVELRYMRERYPHGGMGMGLSFLNGLMRNVTDKHRFQSEAMYRFNARRNFAQASCRHSEDFTSVNYGGMVYGRTALALDQLFAFLGDKVFDRCMQAYFAEWRFKHPAPADMQRVFERESGRDLGWLFQDLLCSDGPVDLKAVRLKKGVLTTRTTGSSRAIPYPITGFSKGIPVGTTWSIPDTGAMAGTRRDTLPWPDVDAVRIDADRRTTDIDRRNNSVRDHGLFRRAQPLALRPFTGLERDDRRTVRWTPLIARNGHDGWHLGIGLHNYQFPSQRTEWIVAPMYAFGSEQLIGGARIEHHFDRLNSRILQNIGLALNARTASLLNTDDHTRRYGKIAPSIDLLFKRDPLTRPWEHRLGLRGILLRFDETFITSEDRRFAYSHDALYAEMAYTARNTSVLRPTRITPVITAGENFLRASLEIEQGFTYNRKKDQLRLRAFAGHFLMKDRLGSLEVWRLSWGPEDMLFDHAYLERGTMEGFRGRQFNKQQGAFRTPFRQGASDSWIASANMEFDLPIKLPISVFGSWGMVPMTVRTPERVTASTATYYEAGFGLQLMRDVIEVWFPLIVSDRISKEESFAGRNTGDRIRFVVAFERLDPTRILRNIAP